MPFPLRKGEENEVCGSQGEVEVLGFEPRLTGSEPVVLPLHHTSVGFVLPAGRRRDKAAWRAVRDGARRLDFRLRQSMMVAVRLGETWVSASLSPFSRARPPGRRGLQSRMAWR